MDNYGLVPGSIAGFAKPREITTWIHGGWSSKQISFQSILILFLKDSNLWCPLVLAIADKSESCHPPIMKVASHLPSTELDRMAVLASASTRSNFRIKAAFWRISSWNRARNKQDQNPHGEQQCLKTYHYVHVLKQQLPLSWPNLMEGDNSCKGLKYQPHSKCLTSWMRVYSVYLDTQIKNM